MLTFVEYDCWLRSVKEFTSRCLKNWGLYSDSERDQQSTSGEITYEIRTVA